MSVQLWAFSADFLVVWVSFVPCHCSYADAFYTLCQILSTLYISLCMGLMRLLMFTRPRLRLRLPAAWLSAFVIGRQAPPPLYGYPLGSLGGGRTTLRRHSFGFCRYLCFLGLACWALWDDRDGCSGPQSRLSEWARAGLVARICISCRQTSQSTGT